MCKRVYKSYKIRVISDDEEKDIKLNGNIDSTSYSTMVEHYHMTKDKYNDESCTVELLGVYEDGSVGSTIFSKTFCEEVTEDKELLKTTDEIVDDIKSLLELLERKNKYHDNMLGAYNKKQDVLLHKVETLSSLNADKINIVDEKLKIIDKLEKVRVSRRINKNEANKLKYLHNKINLQEIIDKFAQIEIPIDTKDYKYVTGRLEEHMIKEIKYSNDKQRINIMKQINGKYKKIVNDEIRKVLMCYNNANSRG